AVSLPVSISLSCYTCIPVLLFFFFTDTATTEIYTLSLHDALPISIDVFNYGHHRRDFTYIDDIVEGVIRTTDHVATANSDWTGRSEEHTSELQSRENLVCRLLLEKKKK